MGNPGIFLGSRKDFFMGEKLAYSASVKGGYVKDALALIDRKYFKRYPATLGLDVEPSAEHLASVDNNAQDPEEEYPEPEDLSPEDYEAALLVITKRAELVAYRHRVSLFVFCL